ncbi:MAG: CehA/McbA family metallohydrolase [Vicinamibacterales bacterium]
MKTRTHTARFVGVSVVVAIVAAGLFWTRAIPPRAQVIPGGRFRAESGTFRLRGAVHVHSSRSDGSGSIDEIARAAARAGLDFVILTDHGDGTAPPFRPQYRAGVLCLDGVEISTNHGHVLALGLPATPFPLAGDASAVVDDIHRFGGVAVAAHPDSAKASLAWRDWSVPLDGFEWLNADSEWRDETRLALLRAVTTFWLRGPETIAALFQRQAGTFTRWDQASAAGRPLQALAGIDAHARLGWSDDGDASDGWSTELALPSYESMFRVLSVSVELDAPPTGRAQPDAERVLLALSTGRTYSTIDALARGGALDYFGEAGGRRVRAGERLTVQELSKLSVRVRAPAGGVMRLLRNGTVIAESSSVRLDVSDERLRQPGPAAYRVEVVLPDHPHVPWLVSNPIWTGVPSQSTNETPARPARWRTDPAPWSSSLKAMWQSARLRVEHDSESTGRVGVSAGESGNWIEWPFVLGPRRDGWTALTVGLDEAARLRLADAQAALRIVLRTVMPMRVAIQLRAPAPSSDLRWGRSVYLEPGTNTVDVPASSLVPLNRDAAASNVSRADTVLLVVDRTNTAANTPGTLQLEALTIGLLER